MGVSKGSRRLLLRRRVIGRTKKVARNSFSGPYERFAIAVGNRDAVPIRSNGYAIGDAIAPNDNDNAFGASPIRCVRHNTGKPRRPIWTEHRVTAVPVPSADHFPTCTSLVVTPATTVLAS